MFFFNAMKYCSREQLVQDLRDWHGRGRFLVIPLITPDSAIAKLLLHEPFMKGYAGHDASRIDVIYHDESLKNFSDLLDDVATIVSSDVVPGSDQRLIIGSTVIVVWPKFEKIRCLTRLDEHPPERTRTLLGLIAQHPDPSTLEIHLDTFQARNCLASPINYLSEAPRLVVEMISKYASKAAARLKGPP